MALAVVEWSEDHTYKNAITNELFLLLSAPGDVKFGNFTYLNNAKLVRVELVGTRNGNGLWNDDMSTCKYNEATPWTYKQGVIASGLDFLVKTTGDSSYFAEAEISLDATITHPSQNDILEEFVTILTRMASTAVVTGYILLLFKGIWTKHDQYYLDHAGPTAKCASTLWCQSPAVFK
ncbi:hypothetical protein BDN72DRAFT_965148 [Pluteus cervinus]|uniref:Uncharacterized protein n=1 Tax=Pluteus cervinus TaxID=181527 RepID=A0ACD3A6K2_9AGAR|nr:hypothetical protein BDN72DRAFT_965148 [Pluteus cervinus]